MGFVLAPPSNHLRMVRVIGDPQSSDGRSLQIHPNLSNAFLKSNSCSTMNPTLPRCGSRISFNPGKLTAKRPRKCVVGRGISFLGFSIFRGHVNFQGANLSSFKNTVGSFMPLYGLEQKKGS